MISFTTVMASLVVVGLAIFVSQLAQTLDEDLNACGLGEFKDGKCKCVHPYTGTHCEIVDCGFGELVDSQFLVDSITTPLYEGEKKLVPGCRCEAKFWGYKCANCTTKGAGSECIGFCKDNYYGARCDILCREGTAEDGRAHQDAGGVYNYFVNDDGPTGICQYDGSVRCNDGRAGESCQFECLPCEYGSCNLDDGTCDCFDGYYGDLCDKTCPGRCSGKNGVCQEDGTCKCELGFTGADCSLECCVRDFGTDIGRVHGECDPNGGCICDEGWSGEECDCNAEITCSGRGVCSNGDCVCEPQFQGARCEMCNDTRVGPFCQYDRFQCPSLDVMNGEFVAVNSHGEYACKCQAGFVGDHCEQCADSAYPKMGPNMCTFIVPASLCGRGKVKDDFAGSGDMCDCEGQFDPASDCQNCNAKYYGPDCDIYCDVQCPNSGGTCVNFPEPGCQCPPGKTNVNGLCVVCGGDAECAHGECFRGRCQCDPGYYGDDCNTSAPVFQNKVCNGYTPVLQFETATCDTDTDCTDINGENLANRQVAYRAQQYGRDMFCHRLDTPLQLKGESACCVDADANGMCDQDMLMDPLCANGEVVEDICNERVLEGEVNVFEWCLSQHIGCTKNGECVDPDLCQDRCDLGLTPEEWIERWEHDHTESMAKIMNETWKFPIEFPDPYEFRHKYQDAEIEDVCHYGLNFADYDACRDFLIPNARVFNLTHMFTDRWVEMPSFKTCQFTRHVFESNINGTKTVHLGEPVWAGYIEVISDTTVSTALGRLGNGTDAYLGKTEAWIDSITFFGKGEGEVVIYNYTTDECADLVRKSAINYRSCEQITFHELDYSWSPFCAWYARRSTIGGFEQRCFDQSKVCAGCEDYQEGCEGLPLKSEYDAPMPEPCNTYWDAFCEIYLNETAKPTGYCAYAECECEGYAVGGDACNLQCPVPQFTGTEAPCGEDLDPPWGKCMSYIGAIAFGFEQGKCNCYNGGSPDAGCALVCQGEQDCSPDVDTPFSFEAFNCSDIADVQSYEIISETTQMCHVLLRDSVCNYWRGRCECATPFTAFTKLEEPLYFNQGSYRIALMHGYEIDEYAPFIKYVPAEDSLLRLTKADSLCADEFTYPDEPGMVCDDTGIKFKNTDWTSDGEGKRCKDYAVDQCAVETLTVYNDSQCTATDFEYGRLEETDELYDADPVQECLNRCKLYDETRFFTMEGDDCRSCTPACDNVTSQTRRVYEFTSEAFTHYDNKIPSDVPCEENRRYAMEDMTMGECFNLTSYEQSESLSNTDASDVYNNGYLLEGDSYRVFDFGEVKRVYNVELYSFSLPEVKAVLETLEASSLAEAYSSPNWVFRHLVSGTTAVNLETRFLKVRGVFPKLKIRPHLTDTKYVLSDTKQGCIKDGNEFTYYDFKPNVYTSEPVECSYSYLREGRCDISYTKGLMSVKECADACALDERLAFTMISGECFCAGDDCRDFTLSSDRTYAIHDNDACAYKFRFQGTCLKSVDGQADDMMGCRNECASLDYPNFMFPCKCVTDCKKGLGEDIYYIQSGHESQDFVQVRSKSCEHYGHKTITNPRVCEDAALILGLEAPTILEVPQSGISGVSMQSVSECNQHCGRQISQPLVKTLLDITDMDTRCDESMYKIADEAGETACVKHNCNYMTSKAVYSDCAPVDRRNYTVITSGTCASAGFADILSEAECDLAAVDGAHSGNTYDSGRAPCYYANGYTFWNTFEGDYTCSEEYPCVCDDVKWQRVFRSYECGCGGDFTFPDVAKGCSAGVYNFDDSNTECENCICYKGEYEFISDYAEIHSYTCEDHGFHTISHMEDCVRALDEMFDTTKLSPEYFSQVFTTDKPSGCLRDRTHYFNPSTKSVPCSEDTPCVCRKHMNSDFVVGGLGVTCESQGYHSLPSVKECQRAVIELKITSLNNIGSGSGCFYKGEDVHTGTGAPDEYSICRVDPYSVSDRYGFKYSGSCMDDMYKVTTSEECLAAATMLASVYRRNPASLFVNHLSSATCGYWNGFVHFGSGDTCSDAYPCICRKNPAPIVLLASECSSSGLVDLTAEECEAYASDYVTYADGLMPKNRCLYVNGKYVFVPGTSDKICSERLPCVCKGKSLASFRQECPEGTERKFENKKICYPTDTVTYTADRSLISEAVDSSYLVEEIGDGMCAPDHDLFYHNRKNPYRVTDYKEILTKEACKEECLSTKGCTGFSFSDKPTFTYTQISSYHNGKDIINANINDAIPGELGDGVLGGRQSAVTCLQRCEEIHNRHDGIEEHDGKIIGYTRYSDGNCQCRIPTSGTTSLQTSSTADSVQFGYTASATTCVLSTDGCDKPVLLGPGKCKFGIDHADKTFDECEQLCIDDEFCRTFSWKKSGPYLVKTSGTCDNYISTRQECEAAAVELGLSDTSALSGNWAHRAYGCYWDNGLYWNSNTDSTIDCAAADCICKKDVGTCRVSGRECHYENNRFYGGGNHDLLAADLPPKQTMEHDYVTIDSSTCEANGVIHDEQECLAAARLLHGNVFSVLRHEGHCFGKDQTENTDTQVQIASSGYDEEACAKACFEKNVNSKGVLSKGYFINDDGNCYCETLPSHPDPACQPTLSGTWRRHDYTNKVYTISDTSKPSGCFYEKNTVFLNTASGGPSSSGRYGSKAICRRGWKRYSLGKTNLPGKRYRLSMVRKNVAPYFLGIPLKSGQEIVMRHTSDRVASLTHGPRIFESSTDNPGWDFWSRTKYCANACVQMSHISYSPWEEKPSWKETNDGVSFGNDGVGQSGFMIADSQGRCYCQESVAQDLSKNNIASYSAGSSYDYFMFEAADVEFVRRRELPVSTSCTASVTGGRSQELHSTYGDKLTPGNYDDMTGRARYCGQECKRGGYLSFKSNKETGHCVCYDYTWDACGDDPFYNSLSNEYVRLDKSPTISVPITEDNFLDICKTNPPLGPNGWEYGCPGATWSGGDWNSEYCLGTSSYYQKEPYNSYVKACCTWGTSCTTNDWADPSLVATKDMDEQIYEILHTKKYKNLHYGKGRYCGTLGETTQVTGTYLEMTEACYDLCKDAKSFVLDNDGNCACQDTVKCDEFSGVTLKEEPWYEYTGEGECDTYTHEHEVELSMDQKVVVVSVSASSEFNDDYRAEFCFDESENTVCSTNNEVGWIQANLEPNIYSLTRVIITNRITDPGRLAKFDIQYTTGTTWLSCGTYYFVEQGREPFPCEVTSDVPITAVRIQKLEAHHLNVHDVSIYTKRPYEEFVEECATACAAYGTKGFLVHKEEGLRYKMVSDKHSSKYHFDENINNYRMYDGGTDTYPDGTASADASLDKKILECARACSTFRSPLGRHARGFFVATSGRCYCSAVDGETDMNGAYSDSYYGTFDFVHSDLGQCYCESNSWHTCKSRVGTAVQRYDLKMKQRNRNDKVFENVKFSSCVSICNEVSCVSMSYDNHECIISTNSVDTRVNSFVTSTRTYSVSNHNTYQQFEVLNEVPNKTPVHMGVALPTTAEFELSSGYQSCDFKYQFITQLSCQELGGEIVTTTDECASALEALGTTLPYKKLEGSFCSGSMTKYHYRLPDTDPLYHVDEVIECYQRCDTIIRTIGVTFENGVCKYCVYRCDDIETDRSGITTYMFEGPYYPSVVNSVGSDDPPGCYYDKVNMQGIVNLNTFAGYATESKPAVCKVEPEKLTKAQCEEYAKKNDLEFVADNEVPEFESICHVGTNVQWTSFEKEAICLTKDFTKAVSYELSYDYEKFKDGKCTEEKCEKVSYKWSKRSPGCSFKNYGFRGEIIAGERYEMTDEECVDMCVDYMLQGKLGPVNTGVHRMVVNKWWYDRSGRFAAGYKKCMCIPLKYAAFCDENVDSLGIDVHCLRTPVGAWSGKPCYGDVNPYYGIIGLPTEYYSFKSLTVTAEIQCNHAQVFKNYKAYERSVVTYQNAVEECFRACVSGSLFHMGGDASTGDMRINGFQVEKGTHSTEIMGTCHCVEIPDDKEACEAGTTYKWLDSGTCYDGENMQTGTLEECKSVCNSDSDCNGFSQMRTKDRSHCAFSSHGCNTRKEFAFADAYVKEDIETFRITTGSDSLVTKSTYSISSENTQGSPVFFPKETFVPQEEREWFTHLDFTKYSVEAECQGEPVFDDECASAQKLFPEFVPQTCLTDYELSGELCFKYEETSDAYCDDLYTVPDVQSTKVLFTGTDASQDYIVDGSPDPTIIACETFELVKEFAEHPLTIRNEGGIVLSNIMTQNVTLSEGEYTYYCMTHPNEMTGRLIVSDCNPQPRFKEVDASSAKECAQGCSQLFYNNELDSSASATQRLVTTHFASMKDGCKCHFTNAFESCQNSTFHAGASLLSIRTTVANDCVNDEEMICKEKPEPIEDEMYMCMTEEQVKVFDSKDNCVACGGGSAFEVGSVFFNERGSTLSCRYAEEEGVCQTEVEGWSQYKLKETVDTYRKVGYGHCEQYKDLELDFNNMILSEMIESCATGCKAYDYAGFYISRTECFCTDIDCVRSGEGDLFSYESTESDDISLPQLIQKWNTNAPGLRCFKDLDRTDEAPCDWIRALKHFARGGSYRIGDCHNLAPGTDIETQIPCNGHGFASAGVCACDYAENFQLRSSGVGLSFEAPNLRQTPFRGRACEFMCPGYDMFNMESVCSGHGRCETDGRCACDQGWTGYNCHLACEAEASTLTCSGHGTCNQREQPLRADIVEQLRDLSCFNETLYLSRDRVILLDDTLYYMYRGVEDMMLDIFQLPSEKIIRFENSTAEGYSVSVDGGSATINPSILTCQTFTIEKRFVGEPLVLQKSTGENFIYNLNEESSAEYTVEAGVYNFFSSERPNTHIGRIEVQECSAKLTRKAVLNDYFLRGTAVRHPFLTVSEYPYMPCQDRIDIVREKAFHPLIAHTTPDVRMECSLLAGYDNEAYTIICGMCKCEESTSTGFWGGYDCRTPVLGYYGKDARTSCPGLTGDGLPCNGGGTCTWGTVDGLGETSYADAQCFCGDTSLNTTYGRAPRNQAGHMMFHVMNFDDPLYQDTLSVVDGNNTECYDGTVPLNFDECTHDWISNGGTETVLSEAAVVSDVRNEVVLDYDGVCSASGTVIERVKTEEKLLIGNKQEQMLKCAGACFGEYKFAFDGRCPEGGVLVLNSIINTGLTWDDKVEQCAHACRSKFQPITGNWSYSSNPGFSIRQNGECVCDHVTSSCPVISSLEWKRFDFVTPHKYVRQESCVGKEVEIGPPEGDTDQQRLSWCSSMCQGFVFDEGVASGFLYSSSNPQSCVCQLEASDCAINNDDRSRYDFVHNAGFSLQYDTSCKCEVDTSCEQGIGEGKRFKILGDITPMPYTLEERESLFNGDFICVKDDVVQCKAGALELTNYNSDCSCRFGFTGKTCEIPRMMCIFGGTETDGSSCICQDEFGNINPKTSERGCCTKGLYHDQIRYATFSPLQDFSLIPGNVFYYDALKAVCKPGPFAFNSVGDGEDSVRIHNFAALTTEYRFRSAVCDQATEMPIYKAVFKYQGNIPTTTPHMVITKEEVLALGYQYTKNTEAYIDKYAEDKCLHRCVHRQDDEPPWRSFHLKKTRVNTVGNFKTAPGYKHILRTYDGSDWVNTPGLFCNPGNLDDGVLEEAEIDACRQSCLEDIVSPYEAWQNPNLREEGFKPRFFQVQKTGRCYCFGDDPGNVAVSNSNYKSYAMLPDISYDCTCKDKPAYVGGHHDTNFVDPVFHKESKVFDIVYPKSKEAAGQNRECLEDGIVYKHSDIQGETTYDAMTGVGASIVPYTLRVQEKVETPDVNNFYDCYKRCYDHPQANSFKWGRPKQVPITFAGRIRQAQPPNGMDHCWGHCNSDIDCKGSLRCVTRSKENTDEVYAWPGCIEPETNVQMWGSGDELDPDVNICYDPSYLEKTCTCTFHNESTPDCLNSYTEIGTGFCSNLVFLDGVTQYSQVLEEDNPLYNPDRTKECMDRCLNEYPTAKAFALDSSQRCACSLDYCTERQGTSSYSSYRINFCEDVSQEGYLLEEHVEEYTLFEDYKYIVGDAEYDTVPINPYTCGIETVTEQGDIVGRECSCPINEFTRLYEETSYVEKAGECYAFRTVNTADVEACKTACEAEYNCDSYSVQNGECYLAQGCGQDWDLQEFAPFFCYGTSNTYSITGSGSTTQCAAQTDNGFFANSLKEDASGNKNCHKWSREYLNMDDCTFDNGDAYDAYHFKIAQISSDTTSVSAYRHSYTLISQGKERNDFYYGNLFHKSYFVRQEAKYKLPEYEAKRYIKELNKTSVGRYCTIGEGTLYSVDISHDDANDHRCMQKCQAEYSDLEYVVVRGKVEGQTFSCLCSDREYTREECEARMETGGTQYKIKVGTSKICKCPGFYLDDGQATSCPPGRYSGEEDPCMSSCKLCPVGQFSKIGAVVCEYCPAGKVQETATSCRECEAGKTSLSGDAECSFCPLGQYSKLKGAGACSDCPIGYFDDDVNEGKACKLCELGRYAGLATKESCLSCQTGRYSDITPVSGCKVCSSGRYNPSLGSKSVSACLYCPKGKYQNEDGKHACKNCGYGYYTDQTGRTGCKGCGTGKYQDQTGQASCKSCGKGKYNPSNNQRYCKTCGVGGYQDQYAKTNCKLCGKGKYQNQNGQTSSSACHNCQTGKWNDNTGKASCTPCGSKWSNYAWSYSPDRITKEKSCDMFRTSHPSYSAMYYSYDYRCMSTNKMTGQKSGYGDRWRRKCWAGGLDDCNAIARSHGDKSNSWSWYRPSGFSYYFFCIPSKYQQYD